SATRRSRCGSSPCGATRRRRNRPRTGGSSSSSVWPVFRCQIGQPIEFAERLESVILSLGGSVLVRRRIQTPSDREVLSVVQPDGEVVLGASPPARLPARSPAPPAAAP